VLKDGEIDRALLAEHRARRAHVSKDPVANAEAEPEARAPEDLLDFEDDLHRLAGAIRRAHPAEVGVEVDRLHRGTLVDDEAFVLLEPFAKVGPLEMRDRHAVDHLRAEEVRRLVDVDGADEPDVLAELQVAVARVRIARIEDSSREELEITRILGLLEDAQELREVVLDAREVHLVDADDVDAASTDLLILVRDDEAIDEAARGRLVSTRERVERADDVAVIEPVGPDGHHEELIARAEGIRVEPGKRALAEAARAREDRPETRLDEDVEVGEVVRVEDEAVVIDDRSEMVEEALLLD